MQSDDLTPDCGRVRNELASLVYDELPADARAELEQHLEGCSPCRDELAALRDTRSLLARWETPPAREDARQLARATAELAAAERATVARARIARRTPARARLVRWSALLSAAAAALLFTLSVLQAEVSLEQGRIALSFDLPGDGSAAPRPGWQGEVRALVAEEVANRAANLEQGQEVLLQRCLVTQQELVRLAQAVDYALAQNQVTWDTRLNHLGKEALRADLETHRALTDLAAYLPVSNTDR